MVKEETKVGDFRINPSGKKPQICTEVVYNTDGSFEPLWADYASELLHFTLGMCPVCNTLYSLERFKEATKILNEKSKCEGGFWQWR